MAKFGPEGYDEEPRVAEGLIGIAGDGQIDQ